METTAGFTTFTTSVIVGRKDGRIGVGLTVGVGAGFGVAVPLSCDEPQPATATPTKRRRAKIGVITLAIEHTLFPYPIWALRQILIVMAGTGRHKEAVKDPYLP